EAQRLDLLASDLAAASAPALEAALQHQDLQTLQLIGDTLLNNPAVVGARIADADGNPLYEVRRNDPLAVALLEADTRSMRRSLGGAEALGSVEITVGRAGMNAASQALRAQLEQSKQRDYERRLWLIGVLGAA